MERKFKLLILEDDDITQHVYNVLLSKTNEFDLVFCKNDFEFDRAIEEHHFDLFVIDIGLGHGRSGIDIIKELRATSKYKSSPILVVTAFAMVKDEYDCMVAGATKFIRKPFDNNRIRDAIKTITATLE
jgi:DNA-binding response OmpR family regulator